MISHPEFHAGIDQVQVAAADGQLLANLPPKVFAGERSPLERPGHIPGSTNVHQTDFVDAKGLLLGHDELRARSAIRMSLSLTAGPSAGLIPALQHVITGRLVTVSDRACFMLSSNLTSIYLESGASGA
jgi:hypothetical protein